MYISIEYPVMFQSALILKNWRKIRIFYFSPNSFQCHVCSIHETLALEVKPFSLTRPLPFLEYTLLGPLGNAPKVSYTRLGPSLMTRIEIEKIQVQNNLIVIGAILFVRHLFFRSLIQSEIHFLWTV
jgi:hypothetical protein